MQNTDHDRRLPALPIRVDRGGGALDFLNAKLSISARLMILAGLFLAPLAYLGWLFVAQSEKDIAFAQKELSGVAYIERVWPTILSGSGFSPSSADAELAVSDAAKAYAAALSTPNRFEAGATLIGAVADGSNLTLDPDLDSFYVMDATTVRIPGVLKSAADVVAAAAEAGASGHDASVRALDRFEAQTAAAQSSLESGMHNNAAGVTRTNLGGPSSSLAEAAKNFLANAKSASAGASLAANQTALNGRIDAAWHAGAVELNRLLAQRIEDLQARMYTDLGFALAALAVALALAFAISTGLTRRLSRMLAVMDKLAAEDLNVDVPYVADTNETGRIAHALLGFKTGLADRVRLQAKVAASTAETEAKLREVEQNFEAAAEAQRASARAQAYVVDQVAGALGRLAKGDLTVKLNDAFPDAYEKLRSDFNEAVSSLGTTIDLVANNAQAVRTASDEITQAADDLSQRTEQQAASLEETAAALDEITSTVRKTAEGALHARSVVGMAKTETESSGEVVRTAITAMDGIEKSSRQIGQIITVIDEIAFQTNLLALNAGVEAARAGDAGRGFAVVASEVRALAQRSAAAAKEIKELIAASSHEVGVGVERVGKAGSALSRISAQVTELHTVMGEIAAGAQEQAIALGQVNTAINQMDQMTQQNAAMVEESTAASHNLSREADELAHLVSRFTCPSTQRQLAPPPSRGRARAA